MSLGICSCCGSSFAPVRKDTPKHPWVMDETLPRYRDPQEIMHERTQEKILNQAKNKPADERNVFDYMVLANDYIKNHPIVMYMA
ncbi:MAG: hypothetical protein NC191_04130 [Muribaculaceae bacterium]|nr:hypothetical protein [Muribaculaceae bacterium]